MLLESNKTFPGQKKKKIRYIQKSNKIGINNNERDISLVVSKNIFSIKVPSN